MTKQKNGRTAIKFLIDRSGSMQPLAVEAVNGMKQLIIEQQKLDGECTLSVSQFDTTYELVHASTDIRHCPEPELIPRGMTALYDSWSRAMKEFGKEIKAMEERPEHIIFAVITDGGENASFRRTREMVFDRVTKRKQEGWEFLYLGANQDAMKVGAGLGVPRLNTMTYDATEVGTRSAYAATSSVISNLRTGGSGNFKEAK